MATQAPILQILRGAESNLPGLRSGEPGFTTDHYNLYVGIDSSTVNNKFFGSHRYWRKEDTGVPSQLKLVPGTEGIETQYLAFQVPDAGFAGINTYVFPTLNSGAPTNTLTLDSISNGVYTLSWQPSGSGGGSGLITVQDEGGTVGTASSITTLNFVGGGIVAIADPQPNGIATITVQQASTSQEGTASFTAGDFTVSSGVVAIGDTFVNSVTTDSGALTVSGHSISILGGEGIDVTHTGTVITVAGEIASATNAGIASFSSADFTVGAGGLVELANAIDFENATFTNLDVTGIGTIANLETTDVQVGGAITVTGATDLNGGLDVLGFTNLDDVNVSSALTSVIVNVSGALDVTGNTTLGDDAGDTLIVNATASLDNVTVGGALTVTGPIDGNGGADILGLTELDDVNVGSALTTVDLNVTGNTTLGDAGGDTLTVNATSTFNQTITGTISTATRSTTVDTTTTGTNAEYYPVFVANSTGTVGETIRVDSGISYNPSTDVLTIPTVDTTTIRHTNDTTALTIDTSGNVVAPQNFTIQGDLVVNGNTTQVNTTELQIEDRTITLGIETGSTPTTTTWDLAVLMQYGDAGTAKTAGIIWDYSNARMVVSANSDNPSSDQGTTNTPVLTVSEYAPIEVRELWINDTEGQDAVVDYLVADTLYTGQPAGRYLQYINVDAGEF